MGGGRRAGDAQGMPARDRARLLVFRWGRLLWGTGMILIAAYTIWQSQRSQARNDDRDAARAYQRCVQVGRLTTQVNKLISRGNLIIGDRAGTIHPAVVPDCERTYPRGARESSRFPDAAPTHGGGQ